MFNNLSKRFSKIPAHVALIMALVGVVGASSIALLFSRPEPGANAKLVPKAARIERADGGVSVARAYDKDSDSESEWTEAEINSPLSVGDRIYAPEGSRAAIAFTGRNYTRLNSGSSLDVLSLADRRTQLALRDGSAIFDVGYLDDGELFEVATPNGAVDFYEPGLYEVGIGDNGNTIVSVLSGLAQIVGLAGSGQISKGEILTLAGQTAAQVLLSRIAPDLAGGIVDDYYGYRYPYSYDGRYRNYDAYLSDPYYYDPYRRSTSYQYLPSYDVPGLYDLDYYGDWVEASNYGRVWAPRVSEGWAPYQYGSWIIDDVWGPTWVSQETWGWAPYHYGRWAYVNDRQWVWVPDSATPVYSPALVAFVPLSQTNQIAWAPLAPGEPYVPRYYDASYQPQYLAAPEIVNQYVNSQYRFINLSVPTGVTAVPVGEFTEVIEPDLIDRVSPQLIAQSQAVLDPYAFDGIRQMAMRRGEKGYSKIKVPRNIERMNKARPVVTSLAPVVPPAYPGMLDSLQASPVPDKHKKNKLKMDRSGQELATRRPDGLPPIPQPNASERAQERGQRRAALAIQAAQGDKAARREMRQMEKQQRIEERTARRSVLAPSGQAQPQLQLAQQEREQRKAQKRLERQQRGASLQQQQNVELARQSELRKQMRRQQRAAAEQQQVRQQALVNHQQREQRKAERRAERQRAAAGQQQAYQQQAQQRAYQQQAQQQAAINQQREQRRAQRQAERQQQAQQQRQIVQQQYQRKQPSAIQPVDKDRQQRKAERQAARQQAAYQQQAAPQQAQQGYARQGGGQGHGRPDKAERKAGRGKN